MIERRRCYGRLIAFLIALVASFYLSFGLHLLPQWALFLPMAAALWAFEEARKRDSRTRDSGCLHDFYRRRLQRLQHEWMGNGDPGVDLQMADHLSARDLDLFGEGSLFELLCDVQTPAGRDVLAQWLQSPAPPEEALSRQHAIRSLSGRTDLREKLALLRGDEASEYSWNRLRDWLAASPIRFPRWAPWVGLLLSLCMASVAVCGWKEVLEPHDVLRVLAVIGTAEGALALFLRRRVRVVLAGMQLPASKFDSMRRMCAVVDAEPMEGPLLSQVQLRLRGLPKLVSQLQRLVRRREMRDNEWLFWPLVLVLWNTQWTMRIERWRQLHGRDLLGYLTVLGEFEALMAIAAYAYENPADAYPELVAEGPLFEATGMGHPLMDVRTCIQNDLRLGGVTRFLLVTGSNMSGKSTLLRAAGLNATLALMGAPVRATRLRSSALQVCASIRIDDSLMNGRSHFYAEVERLKAMFDRAASGPPVLFLIDELFGGTNSADRRVAAEAVIRLLVERGAVGLVTSHDLALTELADKRELKGANVHFADLPTAEGLSFDYQLRPGKVEHSNALKIIRMMGIPLN
jgi:predicted ATPase